METKFANDQQELFWSAFSGKCGKEFMGNPWLMEAFMEEERKRERNKELNRDEGMCK